jgi:hypothetical protein
MDQQLTAPITALEFKVVLLDMAKGCSPGPGGLSMDFFLIM